MPPRRNRISNEIRRRIVRAFEDPAEDYLSVADTLGVNRSTARSIVATFLREGRVDERPRGGRNNVRVDNQMKDCINEILPRYRAVRSHEIASACANSVQAYAILVQARFCSKDKNSAQFFHYGRR